MNDLPIPANLNSKDSRATLTRMVMKLFTLWQISNADQAVLLNRSLSTIRRYQKGGCFGNNEDLLDRVENLLNIHKSLRMIFPHNGDLVYQWVVAKNQTFNNQEPIEVMKMGLEGIVAVRGYLDFQIKR
jgi:flagellar biosynthesis/type III secretory pathway chaperone